MKISHPKIPPKSASALIFVLLLLFTIAIIAALSFFYTRQISTYQSILQRQRQTRALLDSAEEIALLGTKLQSPGTNFSPSTTKISQFLTENFRCAPRCQISLHFTGATKSLPQNCSTPLTIPAGASRIFPLHARPSPRDFTEFLQTPRAITTTVDLLDSIAIETTDAPRIFGIIATDLQDQPLRQLRFFSQISSAASPRSNFLQKFRQHRTQARSIDPTLARQTQQKIYLALANPSTRPQSLCLRSSEHFPREIQTTKIHAQRNQIQLSREIIQTREVSPRLSRSFATQIQNF